MKIVSQMKYYNVVYLHIIAILHIGNLVFHKLDKLKPDFKIKKLTDLKGIVGQRTSVFQ